ncbi:MAG: LCP family protein [Clostridia bacterium]|nr:LCP family protein [Clostridia bacterium]
MDMKYDDYSQDLHVDLKEGYQKLNGDQVEQLVRFRHNANGSTYSYEYGIEDFGRMRTQREVILAIAKQTMQLKNVKEIGRIIDIAEKYVQTNMDIKSLKDYIPYAVEMNTDNIKAEQLPGESKYINGISFFLADEEEIEKMVNELFF